MKYAIHLPMKMEPIVSSETSVIRTQTPGNYPKRNNLHKKNSTEVRNGKLPNTQGRIVNVLAHLLGEKLARSYTEFMQLQN